MEQSIVFQFIVWYFFETPKEILKTWRNFLLFNFNYFSIPLLLKTLFSHWRKYKYSYGRGFDIHRYFDTFSFNIISRGIGAVVRIFVIIAGIVCEILVLILGAIIFIGWLMLPVFLILGFYYGLKILL
ncbi:hypothetical protein KAS79_00250 [Candidatus Parcubacteria bacterium]|nr:hypothetical protein [Candidatus Parcubacteria bacterium]